MFRKAFIALPASIIFAALIWFCINNIHKTPSAPDFYKNQANSGSAKEIPILMYHKVNPDPRTGGLGLRVPPALFEQEMQYMARNGYHTVSLTDVAAFIKGEKLLEPRSFAITFDDGYLDNYSYAFPILKKYGFTATIFVVVNCIGKTNDFDARAGLQPVNKMAGWEELSKMAAYGIAIEPHTLDHPFLTHLSLPEAQRQIEESRLQLADKLGRPVNVFSYPHGDYNDSIVQIVKECGYIAAVTTDQGPVTRDSVPFTLKRIRIMGNYDLSMFIQKLNKYLPATRQELDIISLSLPGF